ncbi:MAG: hypothetical protein VYA80_02810 [Pseudomonadota bacterium]|nr:hypothetical protein [Pseudomonadota bacterium]
MVQKLQDFIIDCSHSWWKFLLIFAGQAISIVILNNISQKFLSATDNFPPFDMQNSLTSSEIYIQLASYTPDAFNLYYLFQAVDYFFPLFAGLMLAIAGTFGLRHAWPNMYQKILERKLLWLFLIPTIFDWLENITLLRVVVAWPEQANLAANLAIFAKNGKLFSMNVVFATVGLLLLTSAIIGIGKLFKKNK